MAHLNFSDLFGLFGPFWPTFAIVLALILLGMGSWMAYRTWQDNRQWKHLEQQLKRNVHASRI